MVSLRSEANHAARRMIWNFMNAHDPNTHNLSQGLTGPSAAGNLSRVSSIAPSDPLDTLEPAQPDPTATQRQRQADEQKFRAARRYSRRIRSLKIGLPVIGAIIIAIFVAIGIAAQFVASPLGIDAIDLTNGQVVMDRPSLSGFTSSNSEYEIVAERALQDLTDPKKVILEKIAATLTLDDGNIVSVEANEGNFNIEGQNLKLGAGVRVHMSAGYIAELEEATIDIKGGILSSHKPVFIESDIGDIRADNLTVKDNGAFILFEERVRMTVQPDKVRPQ